MTPSTVLLAVLPLTTLSFAAPHPSQNPARQFETAITFIGAGPGPPSYTQLFPTDDALHTISKFPTLPSPQNPRVSKRILRTTDSQCKRLNNHMFPLRSIFHTRI